MYIFMWKERISMALLIASFFDFLKFQTRHWYGGGYLTLRFNLQNVIWWWQFLCKEGWHSVHPSPFLLEGGGLNLQPNFEKGGLERTSTFTGWLLGKRRVTFFRGGCNFHTQKKLKSEICNGKKKVYKQK